MQNFLDPRLKWSAELLRPVLEIGSRVAHTHMRHRVPQTRVGRDAELLRLAFESRRRVFRPALDAELLRLVLKTGLLRPASEVYLSLDARSVFS